jgi:hypothetical protein
MCVETMLLGEKLDLIVQRTRENSVTRLDVLPLTFDHVTLSGYAENQTRDKEGQFPETGATTSHYTWIDQ